MTLQIGILVFPRVQQLDLTGPYEVFASMPAANVHLVWKDRSAITSATGLVLAPTMTFGECPTLDVLCIPGGGASMRCWRTPRCSISCARRRRRRAT